MGKKLSEMSLEELWLLFPIFLTEHQTCWKEWYEEEAASLQSILSAYEVKGISHVGSTAIPTIWAKPIIDILVELSEGCNWDDIKNTLSCNGWICMNQTENRMSFNKGYTEQGFAEKVYHLHVRCAGDNGELYFRDYLIEHADVAKDYEAMKLVLWKQYEHNRDGYTQAKTDFVAKYTELARKRYGDRYC